MLPKVFYIILLDFCYTTAYTAIIKMHIYFYYLLVSKDKNLYSTLNIYLYNMQKIYFNCVLSS